jgi:hypothetical protein
MKKADQTQGLLEFSLGESTAEVHLRAPEKPASFTRLDRSFAEFHAQFPEVYDELVTLARTARRQGRERIGIKMLFEVVRWHRFLAGVMDAEGFKLNNNFHSRYARLIMSQEPDLVGIFETRGLRS